MNADNVVETKDQRKYPALTAKHKMGAKPIRPTELALQKHKQTKKNLTTPDQLPVKQLYKRQSLITSMLANDEFRAIYHACFALLLIMFVDWLVSELLVAKLRVAKQRETALPMPINETGKMFSVFKPLAELASWHCRQLARWFTGFGVTMLLWSSMLMATLTVPLAGLRLWVAMRQTLGLLVADYTAALCYIVYQLLFIILPVKAVFYLSLPPANGLIIMLEQARLLMKSHAIVRETIVNTVTQQANAERVQLHHVLYFLWAPTLIFRTEYPRTQSIRWSFVRYQFGQFALCLLFGYCILTKHVFPAISTQFNSSGIEFFRLILSISLPSGCIGLLAFYSFLHCWLNAFAEMTRFGERFFYTEWWISTDFRTAMRTWNKIVHDWLYTYIYRDVQLLCHSQTLALLSVMVISGFFHDFIFAVAFGFCYPIMFVLLYLGGLFIASYKSDNPLNNFIFWFVMFFNTGVMMASYSGEWYARKKCQIIYGDNRDFWMPFSWFCILKNKTQIIQ